MGDYSKAVQLLVKIHEDPDALEEMRDHVGLCSASECQGQVANVVRYLMLKSDETERG